MSNLVGSLEKVINVVEVFLSSDVDTPPGLSEGIVGLLLPLQVAQVGPRRVVLVDAPHQILYLRFIISKLCLLRTTFFNYLKQIIIHYIWNLISSEVADKFDL